MNFDKIVVRIVSIIPVKKGYSSHEIIAYSGALFHSIRIPNYVNENYLHLYNVGDYVLLKNNNDFYLHKDMKIEPFNDYPFKLNRCKVGIHYDTYIRLEKIKNILKSI